MEHSVKDKYFKIYLIAIVFIYILSFVHVSENFRTPYLWFDESSQFWISKGLNVDSDPLSKPNNTLSAVIENNRYYNMDPGGFGILLHFWSAASNHHVWLRLLPFLFFVGVILCFIYLSYSWTKNMAIAVLAGFIPLLTPVMLSMGFEIRAYSMENLGTLLGVIAMYQLSKRVTLKSALLWGCVFAFFLTSRYSEIMVFFIFSLFVVWFIFRSANTTGNKLVMLAAYGLPVAASLAYVYLNALRFQNAGVEPLFYLPYLSRKVSLLFEPKNMVFLALLGIIAVGLLMRNRYAVFKKYELLMLLTLAINGFFMALSFMGKHPWDPYSNRCISLFLMVVLCYTAFLGEFLVPLFNSPDVLKYYFVAAALMVTLYESREALLVRVHKMDTFLNFYKTDINSYNRIYVDRWESPYIKYLFEYGPYKNKKGTIYPGRFTFVKYEIHSFYKGKKSLAEYYAAQPKMNELLQYDLLITPELFEYTGNADKWKLIDGTSNFWVKKQDGTTIK